MILKTSIIIDKDNSSVGSIPTSVIVNEVEKMEGKDVFKYNLKCTRILKLYQRKHPLSLAVKVKLLLFLTYYFKGQFLANGCNISFNDSKGHEL